MICTRCDKDKNRDDFYDHPWSRSGKYSKCKRCISEINNEKRVSKKTKINAQDVFNGEKLCSRCDNKKPLDQFHVHRASRSGRAAACLECADYAKFVAGGKLVRREKSATPASQPHTEGDFQSSQRSTNSNILLKKELYRLGLL